MNTINNQLKIRYGLIIAVSFIVILQLFADGVFSIDVEQLAILASCDIADPLQIHDFFLRVFTFIWKCNYAEIIEAFLFLSIIPSEILEHIKLHALILELISFHLSEVLSIINSQQPALYKSRTVISFHKAACAIRTAVIAVP